MLQLPGLKVAIAVWKLSLDLSKKLRPRTWIFFAALNATISLSAFYAYQAKSVPDAAIPPVTIVELKPVPLPSTNPFVLINISSCETGLGSEPKAFTLLHVAKHRYRSYHSNSIMLHTWVIARPHYYSPYLFPVHAHVFPAHLNISAMRKLPWEFPEWPEAPWPTVVQLSDSEAPDLLTVMEKRLALAVTIMTAVLSILNAFLAFQAVRSFKVERELKELQLAVLRLEVEKLRQEIDDAKREREKSTGIIIVS